MANVSRGYINVIMIVATKNILIDVTTKQFNFFDVAQNFERKMLDTLFPIITIHISKQGGRTTGTLQLSARSKDRRMIAEESRN